MAHTVEALFSNEYRLSPNTNWFGCQYTLAQFEQFLNGVVLAEEDWRTSPIMLIPEYSSFGTAVLRIVLPNAEYGNVKELSLLVGMQLRIEMQERGTIELIAYGGDHYDPFLKPITAERLIEIELRREVIKLRVDDGPQQELSTVRINQTWYAKELGGAYWSAMKLFFNADTPSQCLKGQPWEEVQLLPDGVVWPVKRLAFTFIDPARMFWCNKIGVKEVGKYGA